MRALLETLMRWLGATQIIKIDGVKDFDELSPRQVGMMIDAYLVQGNDDFDEIAMSEFLNWELSDPDLLLLQAELRANAFVEHPDHSWPKSNDAYLRALRHRLLAG